MKTLNFNSEIKNIKNPENAIKFDLISVMKCYLIGFSRYRKTNHET